MVAINASNIEVRKLTDVNSLGYLSLSIKVRVRNMTRENRFVNLKIEACDRDGLTLDYFYLDGLVEKGQFAIVTDKILVESEILKRISNWKVVDISSVIYEDRKIDVRVLKSSHSKQKDEKGHLTDADIYGNAKFKIEVELFNRSIVMRNITIRIEAQDLKGFEIEEFDLHGIVDGGKTVLLTEEDEMDYSLYRQIKYLRVCEIEVE